MLWWLGNSTFEQKCPTVKFQKENKVTYWISSQNPILVKPSILIQNIMPSFDGVVTT